MGYYVDLIEHNAKILNSDLDKAYEILCELNNHNELKHGYSGLRDKNVEGPNPHVYFSWMDWNYPETCDNVMQIFDHLSFDYDFDGDESLILYGYSDKMGDEQIFLNSLHAIWKPEVEGMPCYHAWRGEDGLMWAFNYDEDGAHEKSARITWE